MSIRHESVIELDLVIAMFSIEDDAAGVFQKDRVFHSALEWRELGPGALELGNVPNEGLHVKLTNAVGFRSKAHNLKNEVLIT